MERGALAVAAEVVGVPVEAVEVEVAADLAVFSDPVLAVVVDLVIGWLGGRLSSKMPLLRFPSPIDNLGNYDRKHKYTV